MRPDRPPLFGIPIAPIPTGEFMSNLSKPTPLAALAAALLLTSPIAFAGPHNALNGTWSLVPTKSDFAGQPVVQTGTVTINDREGNITVSRNFAYEGTTETFFYRDMTDSEHNATIHSGKDLKSKTRWDHGVLKVSTTQPSGVTVESYSLAPDGTMIVNVVTPDHPPFTLVFERR
jgi:hypothetical protein